MRYLPILGELFASDTIIFFVIGVVIFVFAGIRMRSLKRNLKGVGVCFAIYAVCEAFSNIRTNNLLELILLFARLRLVEYWGSSLELLCLGYGKR